MFFVVFEPLVDTFSVNTCKLPCLSRIIQGRKILPWGWFRYWKRCDSRDSLTTFSPDNSMTLFKLANKSVLEEPDTGRGGLARRISLLARED